MMADYSGINALFDKDLPANALTTVKKSYLELSDQGREQFNRWVSEGCPAEKVEAAKPKKEK